MQTLEPPTAATPSACSLPVSCESPTPRGVVIGEVQSVDADGRIWLRLPMPDREQVCASCCLCQPSELPPGCRVAVLFQEQDAQLAVVLGPVIAELANPGHPQHVKPETISLEAGRQITLRCGKSSIQLQADGSVLIRGAYVLSRASGTNRIRGGNVQIN